MKYYADFIVAGKQVTKCIRTNSGLSKKAVIGYFVRHFPDLGQPINVR